MRPGSTPGRTPIKFGSLVDKVLLPLLLSPFVAGLVALVATSFAYRITAHGAPGIVATGFRRSQVVSASLVALAHGTNDAQKTMGVITLALVANGTLSGESPDVPTWVIVAAATAISLGTYIGGWRIIRTLGQKVTEIETPQGFSAETSSAAVILTSSHLGFALSTTQVATGSIFGAGAGRKLASVRWGVAGQMALAWLLTLPAAAAVGAVASWVAAGGTVGTIVVALAGVAVIAGIYLISRRNPIGAHNVNDVPEKQPVGASA